MGNVDETADMPDLTAADAAAPHPAPHANRTPDTLTSAEIALVAERAATLAPGQRLSQTGDAEDERHLREAIAEAELLDNPSLSPLASAGEALELGPGFADLMDTLVRVARALGASLRIDVTPTGARLVPDVPAA